MSACLATPNHPDPFRFGQHPYRDLGNPTWKMHSKVMSRWAIIQLTQEEDQAVTNLLKLHHQEAQQHHELTSAAQTVFPCAVNQKQCLTLQESRSSEGAQKPACINVQYPWELHEGKRWSETELEAANTLLNGFNRDQGDILRTPNQHTLATTGPDTLLWQKTQMQQDFETLSGFVTCHSLQNDTSSVGFSHVGDSGDIWPEDRRVGEFSSTLEKNLSPQRPLSSLSVGSKMKDVFKKQQVTDLEKDVVHVLLSLRDVVT